MGRDAGEEARSSLKRATGTFTRHSAREPDFENLAYSFKEIIDALVKLDILEDDAPTNLTRTYGWEKAKPSSGKVTILLEEV